jgi:hypothetical protein
MLQYNIITGAHQRRLIRSLSRCVCPTECPAPPLPIIALLLIRFEHE